MRDEESPSLLVYYLFDDWYSSYGLVSRSENHFGVQLERVVSRNLQIAVLRNVLMKCEA